MFVGEFPDSVDEDQPSDPPHGVIFLVATNITNKNEAMQVLMHEVGHALGLDEQEVAALDL